MSATLDPELEAGLRRLRLRGMREVAPELLQTAKTQRWAPAELLLLADAQRQGRLEDELRRLER